MTQNIEGDTVPLLFRLITIAILSTTPRWSYRGEGPVFLFTTTGQADVRLQTVFTVAGLVCVSAAIQCVLAARAVTPAPDAVRYVEQAQWLRAAGLSAFGHGTTQPPAFPAAIAGVDFLRCWVPGTSRDCWLRPAMIAAALPVVLLAPVVWLALRRRLGNWLSGVAALAIVGQPTVARWGADAIGDGWHLLGWSVAWFVLLIWFQRSVSGTVRMAISVWRRAGLTVAGGTALGLALLARSEALLLVPTVAVAAWWLVRQAPLSRRNLVCEALGWPIGLLLVWGPWLYLSGAATPAVVWTRLLGRPGLVVAQSDQRLPALNLPNEPVVGQTLGGLPATSLAARKLAPASSAATAATATMIATDASAAMSATAAAIGLKDSATSSRFHSASQTAGAIVQAVGRATGWWMLLLAAWAAAGADHHDGYPRRLIWLYVAWHMLAVSGVAWRVGYVSPRHMAPLAVVLIAEALTGAGDLERRWANGWRAARWGAAGTGADVPGVRYRLAVLLLACGALTLVRPLHASHGAHRAAAEWIERAASPAARLFDTRGWVGLLSGRPTYRGDAAVAACADPGLRFVIVETGELARPSARGQALRSLVQGAAVLARTFEGRAGGAGVSVFAWRLGSDVEHRPRVVPLGAVESAARERTIPPGDGVRQLVLDVERTGETNLPPHRVLVPR